MGPGLSLSPRANFMCSSASACVDDTRVQPISTMSCIGRTCPAEAHQRRWAGGLTSRVRPPQPRKAALAWGLSRVSSMTELAARRRETARPSSPHRGCTRTVQLSTSTSVPTPTQPTLQPGDARCISAAREASAMCAVYLVPRLCARSPAPMCTSIPPWLCSHNPSPGAGCHPPCALRAVPESIKGWSPSDRRVHDAYNRN